MAQRCHSQSDFVITMHSEMLTLKSVNMIKIPNVKNEDPENQYQDQHPQCQHQGPQSQNQDQDPQCQGLALPKLCSVVTSSLAFELLVK